MRRSRRPGHQQRPSGMYPLKMTLQMIRFCVLLFIGLLMVGCGQGETAVEEVAERDRNEVAVRPELAATAVPSLTAEPTRTSIPTAAPARATIARTPRPFPTATFTPSPTVDATAVAQVLTREATEWPARINHFLGVQLVIPPDWELTGNDASSYRAREGLGSVSLEAWRLDEVENLAEACESHEVNVKLNTATFERAMVEINGRPVCLMTNPLKETNPHALITYPEPWIFLVPPLKAKAEI